MKNYEWTAFFILTIIFVLTEFPVGARSPAYENEYASGWLDMSSGVISGKSAQYTVIVPKRWSAFLTAERGSNDPDSGVLERILFYYMPEDNTAEPVFLVSLLVQDRLLMKEIPNARRIYETNLYLFSVITAGSNPLESVTDRGIFRQFQKDLEDTDMIAGFISVPAGQWEIHYNTVKVDGKRISGKSIITDNGSVYLPLREICEELGYKVTWHGIDKTITIERGKVFDVITLDESALVRQSFNVYMENEICYVPIVFFMRNLSMNADIDENNNVFLSEWVE